MRNKMVDNAQLFNAEHFKRDDVTKNIDLANDIPTPFKFTWFENKGDVKDTGTLVPNRVTPQSSAMIETDYTDILQDDIVRINGIEYNVTKSTPIHNSSFNLRALRGFSNATYIIELDV